MIRRALPNRRHGNAYSFRLDGMNYEATVSYFENGEPGEIFLVAGKPGTHVNTASRDASIAASLALQYGCPLNVLMKALTRAPDGSPDGPLGAALDELGQL